MNFSFEIKIALSKIRIFYLCCLQKQIQYILYWYLCCTFNKLNIIPVFSPFSQVTVKNYPEFL